MMKIGHFTWATNAPWTVQEGAVAGLGFRVEGLGFRV